MTDKPWLKLYSPGDPSEVTAECETALDMFDAAVAADCDAPMLKCFDTTLSAGTVDEASNSLAMALLDGGWRPGDRLALYLQNVPYGREAVLETAVVGGSERHA